MRFARFYQYVKMKLCEQLFAQPFMLGGFFDVLLKFKLQRITHHIEKRGLGFVIFAAVNKVGKGFFKCIGFHLSPRDFYSLGWGFHNL